MIKVNITNFLLTIDFNYKIVKVFILLFIILLFIFLKYYKKNIYVISVFLSSWIIIILFISIYKIISDETLNDEDINIKNDVNIIFKEKPNVYFFLLESFQPLDRASQIFNIEIEEFQKYLKNNNFTIYKNIFSNSGCTLHTIYDLVTFEPLPIKHTKPYNDISTSARNIISGHNSILYQIFKDNGYMVELFVPLIYINRTNFKLDKINHNISASMYLISPITILSEITFIRKRNPYEYSLENLSKRINADVGKPRFMFIRSIGAIHTPPYNYNWQMASSWNKSGIYQRDYLRAIKSIEFICDQIISKDPNALIILMADHGPLMYANIFDSKIVNQKQIEEFAQNNNISLEEIVQDTFGIFLAIRSSNDIKDISNGYILDPRTLFLHVFAELSDDKSLLKMRFPSFSSYPASQITPLIDGKLNPNWFENPYLSDE
jgi:hypothetical protein